MKIPTLRHSLDRYLTKCQVTMAITDGASNPKLAIILGNKMEADATTSFAVNVITKNKTLKITVKTIPGITKTVKVSIKVYPCVLTHIGIANLTAHLG
jgi:hypothetical protein